MSELEYYKKLFGLQDLKTSVANPSDNLKVYSYDEFYEVVAVVAGLEKNEIDITSSQLMLKVKSSNTSYPYDYSISLSKLVDIEKITSSLKNGILKVKLPKHKNKESESFRIPVSWALNNHIKNR